LWLRKNYADSFLVRHYFLYVVSTSYMLLWLSHGIPCFVLYGFTWNMYNYLYFVAQLFPVPIPNGLLLLIPCSYRPVPSNLYQMYSMNFSLQSIKWYVGKAF
jgi:hypothetical protein